MPAIQTMTQKWAEAMHPVVEGEALQVFGTPLHLMRRQQLADVARAWEIPVERGGTKDEILQPLQAAEKGGVFKLPPKHPKFYKKAMRSSDENKPKVSYSA